VTEDLALCWVHEGRHYKKLTPLVTAHRVALDAFLTEFWDFYNELLAYRDRPTAQERVRLAAAFDTLFATRTDYWALNDRIANRSKMNLAGRITGSQTMSISSAGGKSLVAAI
jgi:hypothetical protein